MLLLALSLGFLIASPQLWLAGQYLPRSIRAGQTAQHKMALGNIPLRRLLRNLIMPTVEPVDGVFGPEAMTFIGWGALLALLAVPWSWWWVVLGLSVLFSLGKATPLFGWTHALHLRIPARYTYFIGLSLAMLALTGYQRLPPHWQRLLLLLQSLSLLLTLPRLWPMLPYVQRWERPSAAFGTPLTRFLTVPTQQPGRVSGLPYPSRTGQVNGLWTLGYNGGSQAQWMARFRGDSNPNGSGAHDWFQLSEDSPLLDWYGVRWAYTYRPLTGKWKSTALAHLYENTVAQHPPSWKEMAQRNESVR